MAYTPIKAIRHKCLDCCCGSSVEVKKCPSTSCPLWLYRHGHRPKPDELRITSEMPSYDGSEEDEDAGV